MSIRQKMLLLFALSLGGIILTGYFVNKNNRQFIESAKWIRHTEQVIHQSHAILMHDKEIEIASKGYYVSRDLAFLRYIDTSAKNIFVNIALLKFLTADNPLQQLRIDSIEGYMHKHIGLASKAAIPGDKIFLLAPAYAADPSGLYYNYHIHRILTDIEDDENKLLEERKSSNLHSAFMSHNFYLVILMIIITLTVILFIGASLYILSQDHAKEIEQLNTELEHKVINRTAELTEREKTLALQNDEKGKRAAELVIANHELLFQNTEKEKRAAELFIANSELKFQNGEKKKRADELLIANTELAFQNKEKEKRAIELSAANHDLHIAEADIRKLNDELEKKVLKRTAELEAVNKELKSFSYSVSHDLCSPLRIVQGFAQLLRDDYAAQLPDDAKEIVSDIMVNTQRMEKLINHLLAFSQIGQTELQKTKIPMREMVRSICSETKTANMRFIINKLPDVDGDEIAIRQVWVNLISNAVKYSGRSRNPIIEIGSTTDGHDTTYYVKDNGAGFDMRHVDKLFGVFQRLHSEDEFQGTGVGLAIVHRIITKHGGRVWAEGKINQGATFYFSLPVLATVMS